MSEEWKHASWVSTLGKWAWIIGIINGIIDIIWGIYGVIVIETITVGIGLGFVGIGPSIWLIIGGIITILISFVIIKPKFSDRCAIKDWDSLYNWVLIIGKARIPWMLLWGIILEIFGYWWGGIPVIVCSMVLLFAGPKPYEWTTEE